MEVELCEVYLQVYRHPFVQPGIFSLTLELTTINYQSFYNSLLNTITLWGINLFFLLR